MKKIGFTIAEILIAMGIIGIVTALTIPTLVQNNKKLVFAKTLVTTVGDFEVAMKTLMVTEDVSNLWETETWSDLDERNLGNETVANFVQNMQEIIPFESKGLSKDFYESGITRLNNTPDDGNDLENARAFESKNNIVYHIEILNADKTPTTGVGAAARPIREIDVLGRGGNLSKIAAHVTIDINGSDRPNVIGRDIFKYVLGADGKLYPLHGRDHCVFEDIQGAVAAEPSYVSPAEFCNTDNDRDGDYCAAYLQENGYNMDY